MRSKNIFISIDENAREILRETKQLLRENGLRPTYSDAIRFLSGRLIIK